MRPAEPSPPPQNHPTTPTNNLTLLLTPIVVPPPETPPSTDPFQPLATSLTAHHVPYTPRNGITDTHFHFLTLANLVIFVITGLTVHNQPCQIRLAELVRQHCEGRRFVVLVCSNDGGEEMDGQLEQFETVVRVENYSRVELERAARLLMDEVSGETEPARSTTQANLAQLLDSTHLASGSGPAG